MRQGLAKFKMLVGIRSKYVKVSHLIVLVKSQFPVSTTRATTKSVT